MGYNFNLSFHEGDSFSIEHDNRDFVSPNVSPEKSSENIVYDGNISLIDFYDREFQSAYEEHIQRQIKNGHGNRVKDWPKKYYDFILLKQQEQEKIKQQMRLEKKHFKEIHEEDKYQRIAKQIIVQIGNIDDFEKLDKGNADILRENMKKALTEYMRTFQQENPHFKIVNAIIHCDEISLSPHLHLTYVGVAQNKRGQRVTNSLNGALKAMGFETDKAKDENGIWLTAQMKWQAKERQRMIDIADRVAGLSIGFKKGNRTVSKTIDEYRKARQAERVAETEQKIAQLEDTIDKKNSEIELQQVQLHDTQSQIERLGDFHTHYQKVLEDNERKLEKVFNAPEPLPQPEFRELPENPGKPFSKKKRYAVVPEDDYEKMRQQASYNADRMASKGNSIFQELMGVLRQMPFFSNLTNRVKTLEEENREQRTKIGIMEFTHSQKLLQLGESHQREIAELKAENQQLTTERNIFHRALKMISELIGKDRVRGFIDKAKGIPKNEPTRSHRNTNDDFER